MKKMKIAAMLITAMCVSLAVTSISGAVYLNADIDVKVSNFIGLVSPAINVSTDAQKNQTVKFKVTVNETAVNETDWTYVVNDSLVINLTIDDQSGREVFLLPRLVFYRIVVMRDISEALDINANIGLLSKIFPVKVPLGSVNVVDTYGGEKSTEISIGLSYQIDNLTFYDPEGENLTMYITTIGFLPGNVNGFLEGKIPIIDRQAINLHVLYENEDA